MGFLSPSCWGWIITPARGLKTGKKPKRGCAILRLMRTDSESERIGDAFDGGWHGGGTLDRPAMRLDATCACVTDRRMTIRLAAAAIIAAYLAEKGVQPKGRSTTR